MRTIYGLFGSAALAATLLVMVRATPGAVDEDRLWHYRNLGKAYYESPDMLPQALEEYRRALELALDSFRERLNYGLAFVKNGGRPCV